MEMDEKIKSRIELRARRLHRKRSATLTVAAVASLVGTLWSLHSAHGAIANLREVSRAGCSQRLSNLYLSGSFMMPGNGQKMELLVGKTGSKTSEVQALLTRTGAETCEAFCKVRKFERFAKDRNPAFMELECEGGSLKTLRMPIVVQWTRGVKGFESTVRLGSSIYGVEESRIAIDVNRYKI